MVTKFCPAMCVSMRFHQSEMTMLCLYRYGDGTVRLTVEQNLLFPNIPEDRLDEMQQVRYATLFDAICFQVLFPYIHQTQNNLLYHAVHA